MDSVFDGDSRKAVLAGPDTHDLAGALRIEGFEVSVVDGIPTGESLDEAGISEASLYVLTEVEEATSIPVAKEHNPDLRAVVYADGTIPEFAQPITDLSVDPQLLGADAVAEELATTEAERAEAHAEE
jgi:hypothetical protein